MNESSSSLNSNNLKPYVQIIEQPAPRSLRFRYECEGRSAGLLGASSTPKKKTYPAIKIHNYNGPAAVVVSCVTKDAPFRPHPHNLVGKEHCKNGICTMKFYNPSMTCTFTHLGVQCVKRRDIIESLTQREKLKVDPFRTGFLHKNEVNTIDLSTIRLCFQVLLESSSGIFTKPLIPVVSDPIYDKKTTSDLAITKLSHYSAPAQGGQEVILLCNKVSKDDIQVWFFTEDEDSQVSWQAQARFSPSDVHKQVAISFTVPPFYDTHIIRPVDAWVQLRRPSKGDVGEAKPFTFRPTFHGDNLEEELKRKRRKPSPKLPSDLELMEEPPGGHRTFKHAVRTIKQEQTESNQMEACSMYYQAAGASERTSLSPPDMYAQLSPVYQCSSSGSSPMYNMSSPPPAYAPPPYGSAPSATTNTSSSTTNAVDNTVQGLGIDFTDLSLSDMSDLHISLLADAQSGDKLSPTLFQGTRPPDFPQPPFTTSLR